MTTLKAPRI